MLEKLSMLNPVLLATFAGLFTWTMTALGAGLVFGVKNVHPKTNSIMLGFAGGVMVAASFWSLLAPSIEMSEHMGAFSFVPALVGFLAGGVFLRVLDFVVPHMHQGTHETEGPKTALSRTTLLVLSITLHNIPEGLAVGVAFGSIAKGDTAALMSAIVLALGIGLQNFPEGAAVSIPLRTEGMSRGKSFNFGQLSAIVEPISAIIGAALVIVITPVLPYALAFAAGAMIYVVVEELIPSSQVVKEHADASTISFMVGFAIMMTLDVALG